MPFQTRVELEVFSGAGARWVVTQDVIWSHPDFGLVTVPRGFITDLASTPQIMHALPWFDPSGEGRYGAIPHDYLYASHRHNWLDVRSNHVFGHAETRLWCDQVLRQALMDGGMCERLAETYFVGVRVGGWLPWRARGDGLQDSDFVPDDYWSKP